MNWRIHRAYIDLLNGTVYFGTVYFMRGDRIWYRCDGRTHYSEINDLFGWIR